MDILIDLFYGDVGKGRLIDYLASDYDMVCRFNGSNNAGHVVYNQGVKYILHIIPSGILQEKVCVIGNGCVVNPLSIISELEQFKDIGFNPLNYIYVSDKAHLITPADISADEMKDKIQKIGTTKSGNGIVYARKASREGFRILDIFKDDFKERYLAYSDSISKLYYTEILNDEFFNAIEWMKTKVKITATEYMVNNYIKNGKKVICEGAQGTLLDIDFGTYPYVTSSSTLAASACIGLGVSPKVVDRIFGVTKCYVTRVGNGEFDTELFGELSDKIIELGGEYGSTTGRKRRVGWLDMKLLQYSIMLNGVTDLCITKLDIFSQLEEFYVKDLNGDMVRFDSWGNVDISNWDNAPIEFRKFIEYISNTLEIKVSHISIGRDRNELIKL